MQEGRNISKKAKIGKQTKLPKSPPSASMDAGGYENSSCSGILLRRRVGLAASAIRERAYGLGVRRGGFLRPSALYH